MQVSDQLVNEMLRNLPKDQQDIMAGILTGRITHDVICNSQDQFQEVEAPVTNEKGEPVFYKSGDKKGQIKLKIEKRLVQEGVKGRVIAHIYDNGQIVPTTMPNGVTFLRASRRRTDGEIGFQSWCGTDSLIAPNEQGILFPNGNQPTKEDLYAMAANLEKNPPKYVTINGEREVDGFIIREVKN